MWGVLTVFKCAHDPGWASVPEGGFARIVAAVSSFDGEFRFPPVLAHGSPIFHSSCEGELGIPLESLRGKIDHI